MTDERKAEILDELINIKKEVIKYHNNNLIEVEKFHRKVEWAINKKEEIDELLKKIFVDNN